MSTTKTLVAVVDDEESVCRALGRLIRSAGMDAETFESGAEFLCSLQVRTPACLILDVHMPVLSGFDVQAQLARMNVRIPVVIITGHDTQESRQRTKAMGSAAYIRKPVDDQLLLDAIRAAAGTPA